jgi:hypothetical protein
LGRIGEQAIFPEKGGEALRALARVRELDPESVVRLAKWIDSGGQGLDVDQPPQNLSREIGPVRGYPEAVQALLEDKLGRQRKSESDFDELIAARLLACSTTFLEQHRRVRLGQWLRSNTERQRTMSDFASALGCASSFQPLDREQLQVLLARLSPMSRFRPESANYWGETVITANGDAAAAALGRYVQKYDLPENRLEQLANIAQSRCDDNT